MNIIYDYVCIYMNINLLYLLIIGGFDTYNNTCNHLFSNVEIPTWHMT